MVTIYSWLQHSLILKILTALSRQEQFEASFCYKLAAAILQQLSGVLQGSFLHLFRFDGNWEKSAVNSSRFVAALKKTSPFFSRIIKHINRLIRESVAFRTIQESSLTTKALSGSTIIRTVSFLAIIMGLIYYFLPFTPFVKLFGILLLFFALYLRPWWGLYLVVFMLPLTATTYSAAVIGLTFLCLLLNFDRFGRDLPPGIVPALVFVVTVLLAASFSLMRADSVKVLPLYAVYFMAYFSAAVLFKKRAILKTALFFQIISALLLSIYGIYHYFFVKAPTARAWVDIERFPELATRVYATLDNPNVLAGYLVLVIPVALGLLWAHPGYSRKVVYLALTGVLTLCMILTFSRGGWLGLVMALLIFAALKEPRLFILLLLLAFISPFFMPPVVADRIASIGSLEDTSNAFRVTIWVAVLRMITDFWLTGIGLGLTVFSRVYRDYMIAGTPAQHAHNLYLQIIIEMGIAGLLAFLWMMAAGISRALKCIRTDDRLSFVLAGIIGALGGHLLHSLFDYVWYSPRIVMTFWVLFGMMVALSADLQEKQLYIGDAA